MGTPGDPNPASPTHHANSLIVTYAVYAAPGMMEMGSSCGSPWCRRRVSGRRPFDQLRPRARPTVCPGRRPVPGIVSPGPPGSTRSRMSPTATSSDARLRRSSPWTPSRGHSSDLAGVRRAEEQDAFTGTAHHQDVLVGVGFLLAAVVQLLFFGLFRPLPTPLGAVDDDQPGLSGFGTLSAQLVAIALREDAQIVQGRAHNREQVMQPIIRLGGTDAKKLA